jgi:hypothetical protein
MHGSSRRSFDRVALTLVAVAALCGSACGAGTAAPRNPEPTAASSLAETGATETAAPATPAGDDEVVDRVEIGGEAASSGAESGAPHLRLDRGVFAPGETIVVHFTAPPNLPEDAWVGLVPSGVPHGNEAVNDEQDVAYETLGGRTSGTIEFAAPMRPGPWDVRMNASDAGGRELASATFAVQGEQQSGPPRVWLEAGSVPAGAPLEIRFTAPAAFSEDAWVGLVPTLTAHGSEAVCDEVDVAYEYLQGRTSGTITLTAPDHPGPWDVRMFDTDAEGREVASATFQVR